MATANREDVPPIVHAVSSAVASIFSNSFVYPLDLITTRFQTQEKSKKKSRRQSGTALTHEKNYNGLKHAFFTIYEEYHDIYFLLSFCVQLYQIRDKRFESVARKHGGKRPPVLGIFDELSIGAAAGVLSRFATSPMSNVVTRSQTQGGSSTAIVRDIYRDKGITGFWNGLKASVILAAIPSVSYYLFELQKAVFVPKSRRGNPKAIEIFLMSATGKAIAMLLLYPVVLLKARTQAVRAKVGLITLVKSILERDGVGRLYEGALPQVLKGFLSQGILMLLKDRIATLTIAGYLAINRRQKQGTSSSQYYFSDAPKTDVNGLIAATKDTVEVAVDQAVEKVKEIGSDISHAMDLEGNYEKAKDLAQSAREAVHVDDAIDKVRDVSQNAVDTVSSNATVERIRDMAGASKDSVTSNAEGAVKVVKEIVTTQDSPQKPVRAISNAVAHNVNDAPEWGGQTSSSDNASATKVAGAEWAGQTSKTNDK